MKKYIAVLLVIFIMLATCACSVQTGSKAIDNISFNSYACAVKTLDGVTVPTDNFYAVYTDFDSFSSFKTDTAASFDVASAYEAAKSDYSSKSFNVTCARFNKEFFASNNLIVIRRYHVTEKPLTISQVDLNTDNFNITSTLEAGGENTNVYRYYFIAVSNIYGSAKSTVELSVNSVEPTTTGFEGKSYISKGYYYKLIDTETYADSIIASLSEFKLTVADKELVPDEYKVGDSDCMFMGNGYSILACDSYIIINDVEYYPNSELSQKLVELYNSIDAQIYTNEKAEYDLTSN